jgi:HemY protein
MVRIFFLLIVLIVPIALLTMGLSWLSHHPGIVHIEWLGYKVETSVLFAGLVLFFCLAAVGFVWRIVAFIVTVPWHMKQVWQKRHVSKGREALYQALLALEQGDDLNLQKALQRVRRFLKEPALALYLEGVAARSMGKTDLAQEKFRSLAHTTSYEKLGLVAALKLALADHQSALAWSLYEQLPSDFSLSAEIQQELIDAALSLEKFEEALQLVDELKYQGGLSPLALRALRGKIALVRSTHLQNSHHNDDGAYITAQEAWDLDPSPPTAWHLVPFLLQRGRLRKAKEILAHLWETNPSLHIIPYVGQLESDNSPLRIYSTLKAWSAGVPDRPQRNVVLAHCALQAHLWGEARSWLNHIPDTGPYVASKLSLLAEIELQEHHNVTKALELYRRAIDPLEKVKGV